MSKYFQLTSLIAVTISGPDALAFCQSQLTADMNAVEPGRWQVTAWCDPKGRCQSVILAAVHEDRVELVAPKDQAGILARLALYAIGRQVRLSEPMPVAGSWSAQGEAPLLGKAPARALKVNQVAEPDPKAERAWRMADLCQAIPWLPPGQVGRHLPQFLGLEHNGGLSYRKGCFPGQEVIARVHYLGKVKYRLLGFDLSGQLGQPMPADLRLETDELAGRGELLEQLQVENHVIGLAVCPSEWPDGVKVHLVQPASAIQGRVVAPELLCYHRANL